MSRYQCGSSDLETFNLAEICTAIIEDSVFVKGETLLQRCFLSVRNFVLSQTSRTYQVTLKRCTHLKGHIISKRH